MNVNQLARNQQMIYKFINRGASGDYRSQMKAQLSNVDSLALQGRSENDAVAGMLQSMGISGMQGRTVREMAQYTMRVQNAAGGAKQTTRADAKAAAQGVKQANGKSAAQNAKQTSGASTASTAFSVRERYTPISDKATRAMQDLALKNAKESAGKKTKAEKSKEGEERNKLIQEHLKDVDPSKRAAAYNTMHKVWENETDRIGKYIKEKTPDWNDWGDKFDDKILNDYKAGVNYFM